MAGFVTCGDIQELLVAVIGEISGTDSNDVEYSSIEELWNDEAMTSKASWYGQAFDYWESEANCPLSDDGVLGGYGRVTPEDTRDSIAFIRDLAAMRPELCFERAADCGAGIGRVTKHLLLPLFGHVDLVEQSPRLLASSAEYIGAEHTRTTCVELGLQDFNPPENSYDVVWIQWVIGHLHDLDFLSFFRRCSRGLRPGGVIILKDNIAESWTFVVDKSDNSVARCREYMRVLFQLAGLHIVLERQQTDFPVELYPVLMFALVPIVPSTVPVQP